MLLTLTDLTNTESRQKLLFDFRRERRSAGSDELEAGEVEAGDERVFGEEDGDRRDERQQRHLREYGELTQTTLVTYVTNLDLVSFNS